MPPVGGEREDFALYGVPMTCRDGKCTTADGTLAGSALDMASAVRNTVQPVGLSQGGASPQTGALPNMVWLYRRPILDYWAEHHETLGSVVTHVLVHEIGHHFGLSDEDMEEIERDAR